MRSSNAPVRRLARVVVMLALLLCACSPPPPAPRAAPPPDEAAVRNAADLALTSLSKRRFDVGGCTATEARSVAEADARAAPAGDRCSVLVARRADGKWLVVVRSPAQLGNVAALVLVSPGGEGVQGIEYAY